VENLATLGATQSVGRLFYWWRNQLGTRTCCHFVAVREFFFLACSCGCLTNPGKRGGGVAEEISAVENHSNKSRCSSEARDAAVGIFKWLPRIQKNKVLQLVALPATADRREKEIEKTEFDAK
jgi:hypothetical protein